MNHRTAWLLFVVLFSACSDPAITRPYVAAPSAHSTELRFEAEDDVPAHAITVRWSGVATANHVVPIISQALHVMATECLNPTRWAAPGQYQLQIGLEGPTVQTDEPIAPDADRCLQEQARSIRLPLRSLQLSSLVVVIAERPLAP